MSSYLQTTDKPGPQPKLTLEVQNLIVSLLRAGNYIKTACGVARISPRTYHYWIARGRRANLTMGDGPFISFLAEVEAAQDVSEVALLNTIRTAGEKGSWQASAWILERTKNDKFGRRTRIESDSTSNTKMKIEVIYVDAQDAGRAAAAPQIIDATSVRELGSGSGSGGEDDDYLLNDYYAAQNDEAG